MKTNFSLLFYLKKPKNHQKSLVPVYMRITVNGKRAELAIGRECEPLEWNPGSGRMKGTREKAKAFNSHLDNLQSKVYEACSLLEKSDIEISANSLKNVLIGKVERPKMLIELFAEHNQKVEALIGNGFALGTLERYRTSLKHTRSFLEWKYQLSDINIKRIDHDFITSYEFYLLTERKVCK